MRNLSLALLIAFAFICFTLADYNRKDKSKVIDLPEELQEAKQGDTMRVERVTKDTIYIGYYNKNNR